MHRCTNLLPLPYTEEALRHLGSHIAMRCTAGYRLARGPPHVLLNGSAIPGQLNYEVVLQPQGVFVSTLNEHFAFESMTGDIFQLGNQSYRMLKIESGRVLAETTRRSGVPLIAGITGAIRVVQF